MTVPNPNFSKKNRFNFPFSKKIKKPYFNKIMKYAFIEKQVPNLLLWLAIIAIWAIISKFFPYLSVNGLRISSVNSVIDLSLISVAALASATLIALTKIFGKKPESYWLRKKIVDEAFSVLINTGSALLLYGIMSLSFGWFLVGGLIHIIVFLLYWLSGESV